MQKTPEWDFTFMLKNLEEGLRNIASLYPNMKSDTELIEKYLIIPKQLEKLRNEDLNPVHIDDIKCRIAYVFD